MILKIALRALARNKVRSFLTMLGVIIGTGAVIAMVAIGQGATSAVQKQIESLGQSQLLVFPGATSSGAVSFGTGSAQTLTPQDAAAIERECSSASATAIIVRSRAQVVYQSMNWSPATLQGCSTSFLEVREWALAEGEIWTEQDVKTAAQVCIIGQTVARQLFADENPIGLTVRVKNLPFKILGILEKKGANTMGTDQDDVVLLPWTTCKKKLQGSAFNTVDQIVVGARTPALLPDLEEEIKEVLRASHRLTRNARGDYEDDFTIRNMTEMMNAMAQTTNTMTMLLALVAGVSLFVGGIGIMNIMLVSVTERTREIGLRMAVGARGSDILSQFLVEAMVLSGIGGLLGIGLGTGGAFFVASVMHWKAYVPVPWIVLAAVFSAAVGIVFGFYPAWRASRLDPIDALRYE